MYYARHTKQGVVVAVVAQLVEPRIVIPVVAGSSPVNRPIFSPPLYFYKIKTKNLTLQIFLANR
jgi:hypothetical protein